MPVAGVMVVEEIAKLYEEEEGCFIRYSLYCIRCYYDTAKFRQRRQAYFAQ